MISWIRGGTVIFWAAHVTAAVGSTAGDRGKVANLYVSPAGSDQNDGSQGAPFRTISAASQQAQPGTTVHVAPGTYVGDIVTRASGTATARIVYVSDTPGGAKIVGAGPVPDEAGWWNQGDYVDIEGFEIDGSQTPSWREGFYGTGSHSTFQGNKVHDILTDPTAFANASAAGQGGAGAEMDGYAGAVDGSLLGNLVYNIGPAGRSSSLVHGIYQTEPGDVANNVIYDVVGVGITLWHGAQHINIVNNTIDDARDGGIFVGTGDSGSSPTTGDYVTVANNIVTNSNGGIAEGGITGVHNRYLNNLFYNNIDPDISLQHGLTASATIDGNPDFANAAAHDYHLLAGSPAIGAGTANNAPAADFDGNTRPQGTGFDIGAYEAAATR